jgi:MYXO-CTERM domain-containing protein
MTPAVAERRASVRSDTARGPRCTWFLWLFRDPQLSLPSMQLRRRLQPILGSCAAACGVLSALPARAHIDMDGVLKGRGGDQKAAPCEGAPRSDEPYVFEPGATIELAVMEGIPHDGYFRISFDDDGTDFEDPKSIAPINPDRYGTGKKCQGTPDDNCGESDFCNMISDGKGPTVLWDHLDPHLGADVTLGQIRPWTVELPNVECDNCTIQVMQVMEDPADGAHGPFDGENDLYYRCVDIVLKKGAGKTPGTVTGPAVNEGIECSKEPDAGSPDDDGTDGASGSKGDETDEEEDADAVPAKSADEGCGVAPGSAAGRGAPALLALLAATLLIRRRKLAIG